MTAIQGGPSEHLLAGSRLLVLAAHTDETFACAGTIARAKSLAAEVYVVSVALGDLSGYGSDKPAVSSRRRAAEFGWAMELLGVNGHDVLFRDRDRHRRLDAIPQRDLVGLIEHDGRYAIDRIRPSIVILPARCANEDHDVVFKAGFAACRPQTAGKEPVVETVLSADHPQLCWSLDSFSPNFYVDISRFLDLKLSAHACHRTQMRPAPHRASFENLERLARLRGAEVSVDAAEAYYCHRLLC